MSAEYYHSHACPAYRNQKWKNPLHHKMAVSRWKLNGATLGAKGSVLSGEDVQHVLRKMPAPRPYRFPWILVTLVAGIIFLGWRIFV